MSFRASAGQGWHWWILPSFRAATAHVERLIEIDPSDPMIGLFFAKLALDTPEDRTLMDRVVRETAHVENDTPVDTATLLNYGKALAVLGMADAAIGYSRWRTVAVRIGPRRYGIRYAMTALCSMQRLVEWRMHDVNSSGCMRKIQASRIYASGGGWPHDTALVSTSCDLFGADRRMDDDCSRAGAGR